MFRRGRVVSYYENADQVLGAQLKARVADEPHAKHSFLILAAFFSTFLLSWPIVLSFDLWVFKDRGSFLNIAICWPDTSNLQSTLLFLRTSPRLDPASLIRRIRTRLLAFVLEESLDIALAISGVGCFKRPVLTARFDRPLAASNRGRLVDQKRLLCRLFAPPACSGCMHVCSAGSNSESHLWV